MKLSQVKDLLDAKVYAGEDMLDTEVKEACGSDLMSDVLAFVKDEALLLTGLQNLQVLRTAEMMDIQAVVFVRGKVPAQELIDFANGHGMVIMTTELPMFVSCGILYSEGLCGRKAAVKLG
ncbi:MAG: hypothetical protein Q4G53_06180 [Clostridia bacterium]|nr:hypothetical protein [Clostridia bacterium]MDY5230371.1 hypothetical protein [Eubacteriales bacterium]